MSNDLDCSLLTKFNFTPLNYNILIVEDSKSVNKILTETFTNLGYPCFSAYTIKEAKEILRKNIIHYLMLDINLPDGSGYELISSDENKLEKIFVLTGETDKDQRNIAYQKGIIDFIVKDKDFFYKIHEITTTIEQLEKNKFKTILVVDDSIVIQEQLKDILQNRFYNVLLASDATIALEIINKKTIDLILLDVELKNSNGIDFLQKNKNEIVTKRKIPVMIISGNVESSIIRDGLKAGAIDIIKKPYVIEEIVLKVDLWIDYKRKEEEVLSSTKLLGEYKDAVDESSIVSKATTEGIITYVNEQFCKLSGYSKDELIGRSHNIVRHPDMPKEVFEEMWQTIKVLKKSWSGKIKNKKKDGSHYWEEALIKPIIDSSGQIIEYIGLKNDITEIESYKEILSTKLNDTNITLKENVNYTTQYEEATDQFTAVIKTNTKNIITYANERFCSLSGYTQDDLINKNCEELRHKNHIIVNDDLRIINTLSENKHLSLTFTNIAKDGSLYFVDTIVYPIVDLNGKVVEHLHLMHDISEIKNLHKEIEETQKEIVYKMGEIGESRSKETGYHVKRVAEYSKKLALLYGLSIEESEILFTASPMHDIGKIAIPDSILKKPGKLTYEEFELMKTHTDIGYNILKGSKREVLKAAAIVSNEHHEKWNGKGYPQGLEKEEIHIYGRITAVADVFDALGSERCYKKAWDDEKIFKLFQEERAEQFDPKLVDLFLGNKEVFIEIREKYKDT